MTWKYESNKTECHKNCSKIPKTEIILTRKVENKIRTLLDQVPDLEWMAMLQGNIKENTATITNITIPEQEAEQAHIQLTTKGDQEAQKTKNIGWIHSHNKMKAFLSEEDMRTASQNKISIVTNNNMDLQAIMNITLKCGEKRLVDTPVSLEWEEDTKTKKTIETKIIKKHTTTKQTQETTTQKLDHWGHNYERNRHKCEVCEEEIQEEDLVYIGESAIHEHCVERIYSARPQYINETERIEDYWKTRS